MSSPLTLRGRLLRILVQWDWLALFLAAWVLPVAQEAVWPLTYFTSLMFWLVPTLLLLPRFLAFTDPGGRRRKALFAGSLFLLLAGCALDFGFASRVFRFDGQPPGAYVGWIHVAALNINIPVEEMLFYAMSGVAVLFVYAWADEYWVAAYSPREARLALRPHDRLFRFSLMPFAAAAAGLAISIFMRSRLQPEAGVLPLYATVLTFVGLVPAGIVYESFGQFVNWRAFAVVTLYVLVTSIVWEAGLAMPRRWWGFNWHEMIGLTVPLWNRDPAWPLPAEEVFLWLIGPLPCVLTYEGVKAWLYRRHPEKPTFVHPSLRDTVLPAAPGVGTASA